VHDVGIQQGDGAGARAQQAAAVLEFLDTGLDEPEGVSLVRVPPVAVRRNRARKRSTPSTAACRQ
jgi:hypothetical protein